MDFWSLATSEIVRNWALVLGGAAGLYLAWKRVVAANKQAEAQIRQTELSRRDHVAELFNRAVGQLNDKKLEVRLGAVFTLHQICRDFPDLSGPVITLLIPEFARFDSCPPTPVTPAKAGAQLSAWEIDRQ